MDEQLTGENRCLSTELIYRGLLIEIIIKRLSASKDSLKKDFHAYVLR